MKNLHPIFQVALQPFMPPPFIHDTPEEVTHEDEEEDINPENPDQGEYDECASCNGTGEGQYDGAACFTCCGRGR
jgi:hypothetical protein